MAQFLYVLNMLAQSVDEFKTHIIVLITVCCSSLERFQLQAEPHRIRTIGVHVLNHLWARSMMIQYLVWFGGG